MKKLLALTVLASVAVAANAATLRYDNIAAPSAVSAGTSDAQTNAIWGDQIALGGNAARKRLDTFQFGIFNSTTGGNTGNLLTANVEIKFFDITGGAYTAGALTKPLLGSFTGTVNFGTGLNAGFFSTITFTGLQSLNINLTNNIMITQQVTSFTGTTNRLGVVTFTTDNIGSSIGDNFYKKNSTSEGLLAFAAPTSNKLAYAVGTVPEPASMAVLGIGAAALIRRRKAKKS